MRHRVVAIAGEERRRAQTRQRRCREAWREQGNCHDASVSARFGRTHETMSYEAMREQDKG